MTKDEFLEGSTGCLRKATNSGTRVGYTGVCEHMVPPHSSSTPDFIALQVQAYMPVNRNLCSYIQRDSGGLVKRIFYYLIGSYFSLLYSTCNAANVPTLSPCTISGVVGGTLAATGGSVPYYGLFFDQAGRNLYVGECNTSPCTSPSGQKWNSPISISPGSVSMPRFGTTIFKTSGATNYNALWFGNQHGRAGASLSRDGSNLDIVVRNCGFTWNQTLPAQAIVTTPVTTGGANLIASNTNPPMTNNNPYGNSFSIPYNDTGPLLNTVSIECPGLNPGNPIVMAPTASPTNPGCPPVPHSSPIKGMNYIYGSTSGTGGGSWPTYWAQILGLYGIALLGFWALGKGRFGRGLT